MSLRTPFQFRLPALLLSFALCLAASPLAAAALPLAAAKPTPASAAPALFPDAGPALSTLYRGDPLRVVARSAWGDLTESDLFLFQLLRGGEVDLCRQYETAAPGPAREALRRRVEDAVREWCLIQAVGGKDADRPVEDPLEQLRLRRLLHGAYETIWIDRQVVPTVLIAREDLLKYYGEHLREFVAPPRARVRYLFLPSSDNGSSSSLAAPREEVRREMGRIQDQILVGSVSFSDAARKYSKAPNAGQGGLTPEFERGVWFPEFERRAFDLFPGVPSPIFDGPDGVYLLYGEAVAAREVEPFERVQARIHDRLFLQQLQYRYAEELRTLARSVWGVNRSAVASLLSATAHVLKIGPFKLRMDLFWQLYPGLVGDSFEGDPSRVASALNLLAWRERIAQDCEKKDWDADPRLLAALRLARAIRSYERQSARLCGPGLLLSPGEVVGYLRSRPALLDPLQLPAASVVVVRLQEAGTQGAANEEQRLAPVRAAAQSVRLEYVSKSLSRVVGEGAPLLDIPARLVPALIEQELTRRLSGQRVEIQRWRSGQPVDLLPPAFRALADDLNRGIAGPAGADAAPPAVAEAPGLVAVPWIERPRLLEPALAARYSAALRQAAVDNIRRDWDRIAREKAARAGHLVFLLAR